MSDPKNEEDAAPQTPGPDVGQIEEKALTSDPFPDQLPSEYRVSISREAFERIKEHALTQTDVELCGVLVGKLRRDVDGPYLLVEAALPGKATRRSGSRVTFTHQTWEKVHEEMDRDYPDQQVVGWYHTHPGFGVFLSEMDQFIQDNFFNAPHQVAFVYDPISEERGLYHWRNGGTEVLPRYWLAGELTYDLPGSTGPEEEPDREPDSEPEEKQQQAQSRDSAAQRAPQKPLLGSGILLVAVVFAAFALGGWLGMGASNQSRQQMKMIEGLVRSGIFRDGLQEELNRVSEHLNDTHNRLRRLQTTLKERDGDPADDASDPVMTHIDEIKTQIRRTHSELGRIRKTYMGLDKLAERVRELPTLMEELDSLRRHLALQKVLAANLCVLLSRHRIAGSDDSLRRQAAELRELAITFAPEHEETIRRALPDFPAEGQLPPQGTPGPLEGPAK